MLSSMSSIMGLSLLGWQLGLWDLEFDRRSADFMKLQIGGRTVLDPWGGYQQMLVLFHRLAYTAAGQEGFKSSETGQVRDITASDTVRYFVANKASPGLQSAWRGLFAEELSGYPFDRTDWKEWLFSSTPLMAEDMLTALAANGVTQTAMISPLAVQGVGVFTRDLPRWPDLDEYYRLDEELRTQWRKRFPEAEARLFIRGEITTLKKAAVPHLERIMKELGLEEKDVPGLRKLLETGVSPVRNR